MTISTRRLTVIIVIITMRTYKISAHHSAVIQTVMITRKNHVTRFSRSSKSIRTVICLFACLSLSACSHLSRSPDEQTSQKPTEASSTELITDSSTDSELAHNSDQIGSKTHASQTSQIDLLTRIKEGFRLPEFRSKHIHDYERWNTQHPTYLKNLFERAEPFLYYIVEELDKRDMPLELALLPAVESAFKPEAVSRSSAAGLWQFIPLTARHYKLEQNWWYDARLDATVATHTALDYLEELNQMFDGDWLLTLAAYNAGQGTIKKAIDRKKSRWKSKVEFEDLKLRKETRLYIPKLYALRNILLDPERFNVTLPSIANEPYFVEVALNGQTDLKLFAQASGVPLTELRHINAGHRRWATAPDGPHRLLVPIAAEQQARDALEKLATEPAVEYHRHRVSRGETLSGISRRYTVSVAALQQANNLSGSQIRAGQSLMIPVPRQESGPRVAAPQSPGNNKIVHYVAQGDTLWSIAKRYRVRVDQLRDWNQLPVNQILNLNQVLTVFVN